MNTRPQRSFFFFFFFSFVPAPILSPSLSIHLATFFRTQNRHRTLIFLCFFIDLCRYCTYFLRGVACTNPDCMYLHELGEEEDRFTKEDMALGKHHAYLHHEMHQTSAQPQRFQLSWAQSGKEVNIPSSFTILVVCMIELSTHFSFIPLVSY